MRFALLFFPLVLAACADAPAHDRLADAHSDSSALSTTAKAPRTLRPDSTVLPIVSPPRIQGVTLDARRTPPPGWLDEIAALGATHITVIPFGFQRRTDDPNLGMNPDARWYTEGQAGIRALARQADSLEMHLVIKPQIWIRGGWSAEVGFAVEEDWDTWEARYREFAIFYARLSAELDTPFFVVGTELARAAREREAFWRALIAEIRTVYDGDLTYAANWYDDAEHVPFWDALDLVGVQAYYPLSEADAPSLATLRAGWQPHEATLRALHERTGKPILFTELGYRDIDHAAARPWEWPSTARALLPDALKPKHQANQALQARLYTAFFQEVWPEPWLAGALLWKFHPPSDRARVGGFTPQSKPAEAVIRTHFGGDPVGSGRAATPDRPPESP